MVLNFLRWLFGIADNLDIAEWNVSYVSPAGERHRWRIRLFDPRPGEIEVFEALEIRPLEEMGWRIVRRP